MWITRLIKTNKSLITFNWKKVNSLCWQKIFKNIYFIYYIRTGKKTWLTKVTDQCHFIEIKKIFKNLKKMLNKI